MLQSAGRGLLGTRPRAFSSVRTVDCYYALLDIPENAALPDIKKAFREVGGVMASGRRS